VSNLFHIHSGFVAREREREMSELENGTNRNLFIAIKKSGEIKLSYLRFISRIKNFGILKKFQKQFRALLVGYYHSVSLLTIEMAAGH